MSKKVGALKGVEKGKGEVLTSWQEGKSPPPQWADISAREETRGGCLVLLHPQWMRKERH